jgi:polysaccharide deacetylase family protein (PEP-CTERM system associated)
MKYFTVDLEDWYHLLDFEPTKKPSDWERFESRVDYGLEKILKVLNDNNIKATFFVLAWLAERRPELIRYLKLQGHCIASHGYSHQLAYEQTPNEFCDDLIKAKGIIEDIISSTICAYRAPGFSIRGDNIDYLKLVKKAGYSIDSSLFPSYRSHGGLVYSKAKPYIIKFDDNNFIREYPISVQRMLFTNIVISGGGYFRLAPLWLVKRNFSQSDYLMTYFHPRDFDEFQPELEGLSAVRRFKTYFGLKTAYKKLNKLDYSGKWLHLENEGNMFEYSTINLDEIVKK